MRFVYDCITNLSNGFCLLPGSLVPGSFRKKTDLATTRSLLCSVTSPCSLAGISGWSGGKWSSPLLPLKCAKCCNGVENNPHDLSGISLKTFNCFLGCNATEMSNDTIDY